MIRPCGIAIAAALLVLPENPSAGQEGRNPAALGVAPDPGKGRTQGEFSYLGGSFRRPQESRSVISYGGSSEGSHTIGKIRLQGSFRYTEERHQGHCWSDVSDPYSGNPYIVGGDVPGAYTAQKFDFAATGASLKLLDRLWAGVGIKYKVGDFSRSDDPRTRSQRADYGLSPGIIVDLGKGHFTGLSLSWSHHKEKMVSPVAKGAPLDAFKYYDFRGLAEYKPVGLLLFSRRFIGNTLSGSVQYGGSSVSMNWLTEAGASYRHEDVTGHTGENPGDWSETKAFLSGTLSFGKETFSLSGLAAWGSSLQNYQEQQTSLNSEGIMEMTWKTLLSNVYYKTRKAEASLSWSHAKAGFASRGATAGWTLLSRKYLMPYSVVRTGAVSVLYNESFNLAKGLLAGASLGFSAPVGNAISLAPELDSKPVIRDNVVIPDYDYLSSMVLRTGIDATWDFRIGRGRYFIQAGAEWAHSFSGLGDRISISVNLGFRHGR